MAESNEQKLEALWAELDDLENDVEDLDPNPEGHAEAGQIEAGEGVEGDEDELRQAMTALSAKETEAKDLIHSDPAL